MSEWRSPTEEFADIQWLQPTSPEWIGPKVPASVALRQVGGADGLKALVRHLKRGLVRAYATHAFAEWKPDEDKCFSDFRQFSAWLAARWASGGGSEAFHGCMKVPAEFWSIDHAKIGGWQGTVGAFEDAKSAIWDSGEFGATFTRYVESSDPDRSLPGALGYAIYYAVRFEKADLDALFGGASDNAKGGRPSKYDWETAIAAFAGAQHKLDLVPDLYAHGAQAVVERWLADWFSSQGQCPAEPTIRAKAGLILRAYQKADN